MASRGSALRQGHPLEKDEAGGYYMMQSGVRDLSSYFCYVFCPWANACRSWESLTAHKYLMVDWNVRHPCAVSAGSHGGCVEGREVLLQCLCFRCVRCLGQWPMGGVHAHHSEPKKKPVRITEKRKVSCSSMSRSSMLAHGHMCAIPCGADAWTLSQASFGPAPSSSHSTVK